MKYFLMSSYRDTILAYTTFIYKESQFAKKNTTCMKHLSSVDQFHCKILLLISVKETMPSKRLGGSILKADFGMISSNLVYIAH